MSDETQVAAPEVDVEVEFASPVLGRDRGAREVLTRSPYLDAVIAEGHIVVIREIGAPPAAVLPPVDSVGEPDGGDAPAEPEPPTRKRAGRGES